jgi:tRNA U34 5-methylaminomethyl-2-thiouridine-forming methyltransferase MnmC
MENPEIRLTADGSKTLYLQSLDETYHSSHGAIQEALHVFIEQGLSYVASQTTSITIFEMGFGTGLNALLTAQWAEKHQRKIAYIGIELHPIPEDLWRQMEYVQVESEVSIYSKMMSSEWGEFQEISPFFQLKKIDQTIYQLDLEEKVDLIYFDAFGPKVQTEMWDLPILTKMHDILNLGGVFVTYCAQGQMKRNLRSMGFTLEALPGPPGKREMTRATKS